MVAPSPRQPDSRVIALLTDFHGDSFYVGAMKGAALAVFPQATIVDVSHAIPPFAVDQASYLLSRVFPVFPAGTVFVCVVDPGVGGRRRNLIVELDGRWIVAPDNGLVSDLYGDHGRGAARSIRAGAVAGIRRHDPAGSTFLGRDVFAPIAAALARGVSASSLARPVKEVVRLRLPQVAVTKGRVTGSCRYVDSFGNILTDISADDLGRAFGRGPLARVRATLNNRIETWGIHSHFEEVESGQLMALLNSWNRLEFSVNGGRAIERFTGAARIDVVLSR